MTPARWRRIEVLFAGAVRSDPAGLASWPRLACGSDEDLHAQSATSSTLIRGRRARGHEAAGAARPRVRSGGSLARPRPPERRGAHRDGRLRRARIARPPRAFTPEPAIAGDRGASPTAEIIPVVRNRLRALALLYLAIFAILPAWRLAVHRETDGTTTAVNALAVVALGAVVALLSARRFYTAQTQHSCHQPQSSGS